MAAIGATVSPAYVTKGVSLEIKEGNGKLAGCGRLQSRPIRTIKWAAALSTGIGEEKSSHADTVKAGGGVQWLARVTAGAALALTLATSGPLDALARPTGVNRPELLPKGEFTTVIDVAGFLSDGQEKRLRSDIERLESDTGFKLRILAQNYPETPGLAIRDYWGVDDNTIVFVADPSLGGNILNFNVGSYVDLNVPRSFWNRLSGKYGNMFYWKEQGEDTAIESAVIAIDACLREPPGPTACSKVQ